MVTFELESMTSDKAVYKYFPENYECQLESEPCAHLILSH